MSTAVPATPAVREVSVFGDAIAYFFVQVKATRRGYTKRAVDLKVGLTAGDVRKMVKCPVPTYVIGVDEPSDQPRAGDPVGLGASAGNPFHWRSSLGRLTMHKMFLLMTSPERRSSDAASKVSQQDALPVAITSAYPR